ncbi:DinB family protein [uncultured Hymenobacter sp.]|uniref:DinB family protein n=1 Tax=uncultured Hymenobacter sp. TaxID=170016 RepID=UPI0035CB2206
MNHRLHLRLEQLERATENLLRSTEALGPAATTAPRPGQWSAAQVVQHLLLAETGIVAYLRKKLAAQEQLERGGVRAQLRSGLLRLALRLPGLRFKAPPRAGIEPDAATVPPLPELRQQWAQVRRQLEQLLNEFPGAQLHHAIFKHPRSGMLTIGQTLDFMLDHVLHHQQQLRRITKAIGNEHLTMNSQRLAS